MDRGALEFPEMLPVGLSPGFAAGALGTGTVRSVIVFQETRNQGVGFRQPSPGRLHEIRLHFGPLDREGIPADEALHQADFPARM